MNNLDKLDQALADAIASLKETDFYRHLTQSTNARAIYARYLQYAYHYVRLTASFTPLAAQRMDSKFIAVRKWILEHSSEEIGHELMALQDLAQLGYDKEAVKASEVPTGVIAWASFFHYKVTVENPFSAFGVLYFLEGMARELAPSLLPGILASLADDEKGAIRFFREHGDLDEDHMAEQEEVLRKAALSEADEQAIATTIAQAAKIKRFMLDDLMAELEK
jgi:pyrroloquinoline quinone (PQQ) biosynthesis protein C